MTRSGAIPRPALALRTLLPLVVVVAGLYALILVGYVAVETRRAARLSHETETLALVNATLAERAQQVYDLVHLARDVLLGDAPPDSVALSDLSTVLRVAAASYDRSVLVDAPPDVRAPLALTESDLSQLQVRLVEAVSLAEIGELERARRRIAVAEEVERGVFSTVGRVQQMTLADLADHQTQLRELSTAMARNALLWVLVGLALVPVVFVLGERRVRRPLARLEEGLDRVADGDLTVRLGEAFDDEVGRLTGHFNDMTLVLGQRAEQQGRLAAAGELVAGVAHEVNNPLMAIALTAETRLDEGGLSPEIRADLQQVARQARRAGALVAGLLRFARPSERRVESWDFRTLLRESLDLVSYQFGVDEIQVTETIDPHLPPIACDRARVEQVLVNLLSNALHAVRRNEPPRVIQVGAAIRDGRVLVSVADNGPGVPGHLRERIFLPFFTTKGEEGTGLGLYISRQVIREDGGELQLDSTYTVGARFVLSLPAGATAAQPRPAPARPGMDGAPLAGLTVLVVDDEATVRRPMLKFLGRRGARVLEAADGLEALTRLERYPVDAILLDLRMPRMDGVELFAELTQTRPAVAERVIFVAGDMRKLEQAKDISVPEARILTKPADPRELEARILDVARRPVSSSP